MEARAIVRQAMAILTPAVPARMEDGHQMLTHWTRKIIVEEGHTVPQLVHILHLIVQHFKVCRRDGGLWGARLQAFALNLYLVLFCNNQVVVHLLVRLLLVH